MAGRKTPAKLTEAAQPGRPRRYRTRPATSTFFSLHLGVLLVDALARISSPRGIIGSSHIAEALFGDSINAQKSTPL